MKHYLTEAVDALPIYRTPEKILEYIQKQVVIKNPPYDNRFEQIPKNKS